MRFATSPSPGSAPCDSLKISPRRPTPVDQPSSRLQHCAPASRAFLELSGNSFLTSKPSSPPDSAEEPSVTSVDLIIHSHGVIGLQAVSPVNLVIQIDLTSLACRCSRSTPKPFSIARFTQKYARRRVRLKGFPERNRRRTCALHRERDLCALGDRPNEQAQQGQHYRSPQSRHESSHMKAAHQA